ncbi:hypothetical protein [Streptomyces platensis]|uniref:hypothetical protein n=1 Tax=Streptomyces platensis TaxID=58346 RepID=UPI002E812730|nr:hypothetical protein [Streptomyces platensis]WUB77838.1 hypothetical protein OG424_00710 [Streptomyces platensis]
MGRHFTFSLLTAEAMHMAADFTFSTSNIGHRLGVLLRRLDTDYADLQQLRHVKPKVPIGADRGALGSAE